MSGLKVEFIVNYDETPGRDLEIAKQCRNTVTGPVVIGLWLHQQHALARDFRLAGSAPETTATKLNVLCLCDPPQYRVPVVPPPAAVCLPRMPESGAHPQPRRAPFLRSVHGRFSSPPK